MGKIENVHVHKGISSKYLISVYMNMTVGILSIILFIVEIENIYQ